MEEIKWEELEEHFGLTTDVKEEKRTVIDDIVYECMECSSMDVVADDEKVVCRSCGIVLGSIFETQGEWRYYGASDTKRTADPTRCGIPINPLLPEMSNSVVIHNYGSARYSRLQRWNSISHKEKSLIEVFRIMQDATYGDLIPASVLDKAQVMYKIVSEATSRRGDIRLSLMAACIYYACQDRKIPRTQEQIAKVFGISTKKLTIGCNHCKEILYAKDPVFVSEMKEETVEDIINRICSILDIHEKAKNKSIQIYEKCQRVGLLLDNTPQSSSVAIVYFVCSNMKIKKTKKVIADIVGVSEVTVAKTHKILKKYTKELLTDD